LDHVKKDLELAQTNCQSLKNEQRKLFGVLNENQMLKEELNQYQVNHDGQLTWEESKTLLERVTTLEKENAHLTEAKYSLEKQLSPVQKKCDEMEDDLQKSRRLHVQLSAELDHAKKNLELAQTNYQSLESEQRKLFGVLNENQMLKEELDQYQVNHAGQLTQEGGKIQS
jgi:predicted nuclease with TOPRIM domain